MKLTINDKKDSMSFGDYIFETIRENIINWNIKPGTKISEKEISDALGVSRTPVREAFIKLAKEDIVEVIPQKGTFISYIDLDHVEESRFIRKALEVAVVKLAAEKISDQYLEKLKDILDKQKVLVKAKAYEDFYDLDEAFHRQIFLSVNKKRTSDIINLTGTQYKQLRMLSYLEDVNWNKVIVHHEKIYEALKTRDADKAVQYMEEHLDKMVLDLIEIKNRYSHYFKQKAESVKKQLKENKKA